MMIVTKQRQIDLEIEYLCGADFGAVGKRDQIKQYINDQAHYKLINILNMHVHLYTDTLSSLKVHVPL